MENKAPAPFEESSPLSQILLFLGMTLISFCVLMVVLTILQATGWIDLTKFADITSYSDKSVINSMRNIQLLQDVMIFVIPTIVFSFLVSRNRLQYLQMSKIGNPRLLVLGIITIVTSIPLINWLVQLNQLIPLPGVLQRLEQEGDVIETAFEQQHTLYDLVCNLFVMAFFAGFAEELFFRAGLQKIVIKMTKNIHIGIWITAAAFSAIHLQFSGFIPRMLLGVFLGYLYVWSGSIWVGVFAHSMFNGSQIIAAYILPGKSTSAGAFSESPGYVYIIISAVAVVALLIVTYRISQKKDNDVIVISE